MKKFVLFVFTLSSLNVFASSVEFPPSKAKNVNIEGATYSCTLTNDPSQNAVFLGESDSLYSDASCQGNVFEAYNTAVARCYSSGYTKCGGPYKTGLWKI